MNPIDDQKNDSGQLQKPIEAGLEDKQRPAVKKLIEQVFEMTSVQKSGNHVFDMSSFTSEEKKGTF